MLNLPTAEEELALFGLLLPASAKAIVLDASPMASALAQDDDICIADRFPGIELRGSTAGLTSASSSLHGASQTSSGVAAHNAAKEREQHQQTMGAPFAPVVALQLHVPAEEVPAAAVTRSGGGILPSTPAAARKRACSAATVLAGLRTPCGQVASAAALSVAASTPPRVSPPASPTAAAAHEAASLQQTSAITAVRGLPHTHAEGPGRRSDFMQTPAAVNPRTGRGAERGATPIRAAPLPAAARGTAAPWTAWAPPLPIERLQLNAVLAAGSRRGGITTTPADRQRAPPHPAAAGVTAPPPGLPPRAPAPQGSSGGRYGSSSTAAAGLSLQQHPMLGGAPTVRAQQRTQHHLQFLIRQQDKATPHQGMPSATAVPDVTTASSTSFSFQHSGGSEERSHHQDMRSAPMRQDNGEGPGGDGGSSAYRWPTGVPLLHMMTGLTLLREAWLPPAASATLGSGGVGSAFSRRPVQGLEPSSAVGHDERRMTMIQASAPGLLRPSRGMGPAAAFMTAGEAAAADLAEMTAQARQLGCSLLDEALGDGLPAELPGPDATSASSLHQPAATISAAAEASTLHLQHQHHLPGGGAGIAYGRAVGGGAVTLFHPYSVQWTPGQREVGGSNRPWAMTAASQLLPEPLRRNRAEDTGGRSSASLSSWQPAGGVSASLGSAGEEEDEAGGDDMLLSFLLLKTMKARELRTKGKVRHGAGSAMRDRLRIYLNQGRSQVCPHTECIPQAIRGFLRVPPS